MPTGRIAVPTDSTTSDLNPTPSQRHCQAVPVLNTGGGPDVFQLIMGHQLLVWNQAGITCEVSFHGISQVNVDLDVAVADATTMVTARRR